MRPVGVVESEPRTFSVFNVTVNGGVLPILMLDALDGRPHMASEAVDFARSLMRKGLSLSRTRSAVYAIGLLHDHFVHCEAANTIQPDNLPDIIQRFLVNRLRGTVDRDGNDSTGLFWTKVRWSAVKRDRSHIRAYSDFCARHYGHFPLVPKCAPVTFGVNEPAFQRTVEILGHRRKELEKESNRSDLLAHLSSRRQFPRSLGIGLAAPRLVMRGHERNRQHIPLEKIPELILKTRSVVQRMIFIEAAFGGSRPSEQLNQWIDDVLPGTFRKALFPDDEPSDWPLVVLAHPTESTWVGRMGDGSTTREQFLMSRYGLRPRTFDETGPAVKAGWKGMAIENEERVISQVYWISDFWAKQYYMHYKYLLNIIRPEVPIHIIRSHPYLYINDNPKTKYFGMPMKMSNLKKAMERALVRVGLVPYEYKCSIYGLRHSYMKMCRKMGLNPETRQQVFRHLSIESQEAYGHWTPGELNANLRGMLK